MAELAHVGLGVLGPNPMLFGLLWHGVRDRLVDPCVPRSELTQKTLVKLEWSKWSTWICVEIGGPLNSWFFFGFLLNQPFKD